MDAFALMDKLEEKEIAEAKYRLRKLTNTELAVLWKHYFKSDNPYDRLDTIRELAIELVMEGK